MDQTTPNETDDDVFKVRRTGVTSKAAKFGEAFLSLFKWNQGCLELIWLQILIYCFIYSMISIVYNYGLSHESQQDFDALATYLSGFVSTLPMILVLGFFTSTALNRWYSTIYLLPGTNKVIKILIESLKEDVPDGRYIIDHYIRYVLLFWLLNLRVICEPLRRKYPTLIAIERKTGLLRENERIKLEEYEKQSGGKRTVPLVVYDWLNAILKDLLRGQVINAPDYWRNMEAVQNLKKGGGNLIKFATQNTPNVLIQTVTIAIYCYGLVTMLGHQMAGKSVVTSILSSYLPLPYALSFFFYYVWLKIGRMATDPFGDDYIDIDVVGTFASHVSSATRLRDLYGRRLESLLTPPIVARR